MTTTTDTGDKARPQALPITHVGDTGVKGVGNEQRLRKLGPSYLFLSVNVADAVCDNKKQAYPCHR
jgi:hypothetical protein